MKLVGLQMQVNVAEILLYEVSLQEELAASLAPPERLEMLWKCLQATRAVFSLRTGDGRLSATPWMHRYTALTSLDFTFSMLTCLRLSTLNLPGWDLWLVRQEVDFNRTLSLQHQNLKKFADMRRERLLASGAGVVDGREGTGGGGGEEEGGRRRNLPPGFVDPYECLQSRVAQLGIMVEAELAATMPLEASPIPSRWDHPTVPGEETSTRTAASGNNNGTTVSSIGGGGQGQGQGVAAAAAAANVPAPASSSRDDLDEMLQAFHQSFWQDMDRVDDAWGTNFDGLLWGFGDPNTLGYPRYQ